MKIPLSRRLLACCDYIVPGDRVADIGCDHGYLGIHLLQKGLASSVIASDVNKGPLQSARINAEKYGVQEQMSFYLSNGVRNIPRDFTVLVCAGMGADTMISILRDAPWLQDGCYRLVLQCQSKTHCLRQYLSESGWLIQSETVVQDGKFLYTVMEVVWNPGQTLTPGQCYLSPALLAGSTPELKLYCRRILNGLRLAVQSKGADAVPQQALALHELEALAQDPNWKEILL